MAKQNTGMTRRTLLATTGGLIAAGTMSVGGAARGPGGGSGKNTCPDGSVLLAKYEVEDGEFVFEKDSGYLEVGDAFDLTITKTKEEGEILAFEFEDPTGVYDVHKVSVKTGEGIFRKEIDSTGGSFDAREFDDQLPVQAVSNLLICARVWWQLDFGRGEVPQPPFYSNRDGRRDDLVLAATGDGTTQSIDNPSFNRDSNRHYVNISNDEFDIDLTEGTAKITFEENTADKLHLVSFETPGEYNRRRKEIEAQDQFDVEYTGDTEGTLTVDIPTPDAY